MTFGTAPRMSFRLFTATLAVSIGAMAGSVQAGVIIQNISVDGTATVAFATQTSPIAPVGPGNYFGDLDDPDTIPPFVDIFKPTLSVSASGQWGHGQSGSQMSGPGGLGSQVGTQPQYEAFGISIVDLVELNTLLGVFTDNVGPTAGAAPARLTAGLSDMTMPLLNQTFAIGDGLSDIVVPAGATRLYFGLHDGFEWTNNSGSVDVTVTQVPAPAVILLFGTGLIGLGYWKRRGTSSSR